MMGDPTNVTMTDEKTTEQIRQAIANYAGLVTRCPPGNARAPAGAVVKMDDAVEWLRMHRGDRPFRNAKAARRLMRMARAQQQRVAKCNALLLKRIAKQELSAGSKALADGSSRPVTSVGAVQRYVRFRV